MDNCKNRCQGVFRRILDAVKEYLKGLVIWEKYCFAGIFLLLLTYTLYVIIISAQHYQHALANPVLVTTRRNIPEFPTYVAEFHLVVPQQCVNLACTADAQSCEAVIVQSNPLIIQATPRETSVDSILTLSFLPQANISEFELVYIRNCTQYDCSVWNDFNCSLDPANCPVSREQGCSCVQYNDYELQIPKQQSCLTLFDANLLAGYLVVVDPTTHDSSVLNLYDLYLLNWKNEYFPRLTMTAHQSLSGSVRYQFTLDDTVRLPPRTSTQDVIQIIVDTSRQYNSILKTYTVDWSTEQVQYSVNEAFTAIQSVLNFTASVLLFLFPLRVFASQRRVFLISETFHLHTTKTIVDTAQETPSEVNKVTAIGMVGKTYNVPEKYYNH